MAIPGLKIAHKLALVGLLLLAPLAFALWQVATEQRAPIRVATEEIAGVRYLAALAPIQARLDLAIIGTASVPTDGADAIAAAQASFGDILGTAKEAQAAVSALRATHDGGDLAPARAKLRELIARVSDRSNLLLDGVAETRGLAEIVAVSLPEMMDGVADVSWARDSMKGTKDMDGRARVLVTVGGFGATLDGMRDAMDAVGHDSSDGSGEGLRPDLKRLYDFAQAHAAAAQRLAPMATDPSALIGSARSVMLEAADALRARLAARIRQFDSHRDRALSLSLVLLLVVGLVATMLARMVVITPLGSLADTAKRLAAGDLEAPLAETSGRDELAALSRAMTVFKAAMTRNAALEHRREQDVDAVLARLEAMQSLSRDFSLSVTGKLASVAESVGWLSSMPSQLGQTAVRAKTSATEAETTVRQARGAMEAAASTAEELASAGQGIAEHVRRALAATRGAAEQADQARGLVHDLGEIVSAAGEVVHLVTAIAGQSGQLALDATGEAEQSAAAAGNGGGRVARDLAALAEQAARATDDITARIGGVRASAERASAMVGDILDRIGQVEASSGAIAAAITEQGAVTSRMCRDAQVSVDMLLLLSRSIGTVRTDATDTESTAEGLAAMAQSLSAEIDALRSDVTEFVTANMPNIERRASKRYEADLAVTLATPTGIPMRGRMRDISFDGAAVETGAHFPVGASVVMGGLCDDPVTCRVVASGDGLVRLQFRHDAITRRNVRALVLGRYATSDQPDAGAARAA